MATTTRRGKSKNLTMDHDALELLPELSPGPNSQGRFLSELVRREHAIRTERQRLKARVLQALDETTIAEQEK